MKLYKSNNSDTVELCQYYFGFEKPSVLWTRYVREFDNKLDRYVGQCLQCPYSPLLMKNHVLFVY